ncbi:MAG: M13-type metalloendopeptidase [Actinomycetaceae bacterium]|nr:M13-type metalloendopeptidase [Actinomycetaceae bacterium]
MTDIPVLLPTHFDTDSMNSSIRPQDDLYRFINGHWLDTYKIPDDKAMDGIFHRLRDESEQHRKEIIDACVAGHITEGKALEIAQLFQAYMDTDTIEAYGLNPLRPVLERIDQVGTKKELTEVVAQLGKTGDAPAPACGISVDPNDPRRYVFILSQGGLGLPDESYYRDEAYADVREAYVSYIAALLKLAQDESASEHAKVIMDFETQLAATHWDSVTMRDTDKTNNPMSWADMKALGPAFDWDRWAEHSGIATKDLDTILVTVPPHVEGFSTLWENTDINTVKQWIRFHYIDGYASLLGDRFVQTRFDFYGTVLTGAQQIRPRWKRGVGCVESSLGEPLGELYVAQHFPPSHKQAMEELVENLLEAYRDSITNLEWMSSDTKKRAQEKLSQFVTKIGYPDTWRDYSQLHFDKDSTIIDMVRRVAEFEYDYELAKLGKPVDRSEWHMTPQTVNAYYNPTQNEIVFPAAILQHPFFDADALLAQNYGAIGAVIGHEIGHGFDDQGAKFDGEGRINNWWTPSDEEEFRSRTQALIDYYADFSPAQLSDDYKVNGALTIGENIGDLGGLTIAYKAWLSAKLKEGEEPTADEKRLFFYSWAFVWRTKVRDELAIQLLTIDPHSPSEFRCNGVVAHSDAFAEAFNLNAGDRLWIDPDQRVRIW